MDFYSGLIILTQQCFLCYENTNACVCQNCESHFQTTQHRCISCAVALNSTYQYCSDCLRQAKPIKQSWVCYDYDEHLAYLIKKFKYQKQLAIGDFFAKKISQAYQKISQYHHYDFIIPMPIHIKRITERGFNQSIELTRHLAKQHPEKFNPQYIIRQKYTLSFTKLTLKQRQQQVKKIFATNVDFNAFKTILVIDDVITTGSTINELAKTIYQQNPRIQIDALCLARADLKK